MDEEFAKQLERIANDATPLPKVQPKPVNGREVDVPLSEQWAMSERIRSELRTRLNDLRFRIRADYEQAELRIRTDYEQKIERAVSALEEEKRLALCRLADETAEKLREHDLLAKRMAQTT